MDTALSNTALHLSMVWEMLVYFTRKKEWLLIPGLLIWALLPLVIILAILGLLLLASRGLKAKGQRG